MLVNKQGMVAKYKELNREHKKKVQENAEMAAELARLRKGGVSSGMIGANSQQYDN